MLSAKTKEKKERISLQYLHRESINYDATFLTKDLYQF